MHPRSVRIDVFTQFHERKVTLLEIADHPALKIFAVTFTVIEHPDEIIVCDALVRRILVVEPVVEVVKDGLVAVDDVLFPDLLMVTVS